MIKATYSISPKIAQLLAKKGFGTIDEDGFACTMAAVWCNGTVDPGFWYPIK